MDQNRTGVRERFRSRVIHSFRNHVLNDSCGCAMGARFLLVALLVLIPLYWWNYEHQNISGLSACIQVFIFLFLFSGLGKAVGILLNRILVRKYRSKDFLKKISN